MKRIVLCIAVLAACQKVDESKFEKATDANATFLKVSDAEANYLQTSAASATYLAQQDASATFLSKGDATATYLKQTDASALFLDKSDAAAAYLAKSDAASAYLARTDAASTYLSQSAAAASYQKLGSGCPAGQLLRGYTAAGAAQCVVAYCPLMMADCDGNVGNGCETSLSDPNNCGACGNVCAAGTYCSQTGQCVPPLADAAAKTAISGWAGVDVSAWKLCYKLSRDTSLMSSLLGAGATAFHTQCDSRGATYFIARSSLGKVFGGYTSVGFGQYKTLGCNYRSDTAAFLFSISSNAKLALGGAQGSNSSTNAIYDCDDRLAFGAGHDYYTDLRTYTYSGLGESYVCPVGAYNSTACKNYLAGGYSAGLQELEVYTQQ